MEQAFRIWKGMLYTIPVDALILDLTLPAAGIDTLYMLDLGLIGLMVLSLLLSFKSFVFAARAGILQVQNRVSTLDERLGRLLIYGVIGILVLLEVLGRLSRFNLLSIVVALLIGLSTGSTFYHGLIERRQYDKRVKRDRLLWLANSNRQIFLLVIVPLIPARAVCLLGAVRVMLAHEGLIDFLPFAAASAGLLIALSPQREHFLINCSRCQSWASRALASEGHCTLCARDRYQPFIEGTEDPDEISPVDSVPPPARDQSIPTPPGVASPPDITVVIEKLKKFAEAWARSQRS
jgi:hypothetical protein